MRITIINGPNLNLLGRRESQIYGVQTFEAYLSSLQSQYNYIDFSVFQSNIEGELITYLQKSEHNSDGIILNAAGYTHTSVGIGDAIRAIDTPVVEVHISNTFARESYRHKSFLTPYVKGLIVGFGLDVYRLAVESFLQNTKKTSNRYG
ncbi:MAG: 3-dehydroquinate dehydratase [Flavobacteriaceae bacterium]|nr:3-dehydroquinate dehydratase [Flavobacteriaceae bacterium]